MVRVISLALIASVLYHSLNGLRIMVVDFWPAGHKYQRQMYWTDRGDSTVSRAPMDPPSGADPAHRADREILVRGAGQAIGIALDVPSDVMYYTALDTGAVSTAHLDGSGSRVLVSGQGALTGISLVQLP